MDEALLTLPDLREARRRCFNFWGPIVYFPMEGRVIFKKV